MPFRLRRFPSMDLRKASRLLEAPVTKHQTISFNLDDDMETLYRSKVHQNQIRVTSSSPILSSLYQSDEEQPSPHTDEFESQSELSEYASCDSSADETDDLGFDGDDEEVGFEVDDIETTFITAALAIAVPIKSVKPSLVEVSVLAPMAKRTIPISRPQSASYATFVRVKAPSPTPVRASFYDPVPERPLAVRNFSTPLPRSRSLSPPESLHSGSSPASSVLSLSHGSIEEGDALIRESDEIQIRQTILSGTDWDNSLLESPTPTSYAAYDPFALSIPTLIKQQPEQQMQEKSSGWKRLGLKTKILAVGRRARA